MCEKFELLYFKGLDIQDKIKPNLFFLIPRTRIKALQGLLVLDMNRAGIDARLDDLGQVYKTV